MTTIDVPQYLGHGVAELRDDRDKIKEQIPFENEMLLGGREAVLGMIRQVMHDGVVQGSVLNQPSAYTPYAFQYIFLTDDSSTVDPDETGINPGVNILGMASKDAYAGSDIYRGSMNFALSYSSRNKIRYVWDWPTHAAIGDIESLGFGMLSSTTLHNGTYYAYSILLKTPASGVQSSAWLNPFRSNSYLGTSHLDIDPTTERLSFMTARTGTSIRYQSSTNYDQNVINSGELVALTETAGAFCFDPSGDIWYIMNASPYTIKRVTKATPGSVVTSFAKPWGISGTAIEMTHGGGYLWITDPNGDVLYQLNPSTGATVNSWNCTTGSYAAEIDALAWSDYFDCLVVGLYQPGQVTQPTAITFYVNISATTCTPICRPYASSVGSSTTVATSSLVTMDHVAWGTANNGSSHYMFCPAHMATRSKLSSTLVKPNTQTLRITYDLEPV